MAIYFTDIVIKPDDYYYPIDYTGMDLFPAYSLNLYKEIEKYVTHTTLKDSVKKAAGRLMDGDELGVVFEEEKILPSAYAHTLFIAGRNGDSLAAIGMITKRLNEDCANELESTISKAG